MAKFNLPDFVVGRPLYASIVQLQQESPEIFIPDTEIASIFGCPVNAVWNGGGMALGGNMMFKQEVKDLIEFYNYELHLPIRFTFTNSLIGEKECWDSYCNMLAECGHNGHNEILTSSPTLEKYLRENYPNYKFCRSIIAAGTDPLGEIDKYDLVVCRRNMNNNWDFLETIPINKRHKVEFLCTDPCPDNCPRLYTHYRDFARGQLDFELSAPNTACSMGQVKGPFPLHYTKTKLKTYISRETIDKEYAPRGFSMFKLSGRGNPIGMILNVVDYMIKPEYQFDVIAILGAGYAL